MVNDRCLTIVCAVCLGAILHGAAPPGRAGDSRVADAAMRADVVAVRALLEQGAEVNGAQGDGMTALHWAAEHGDHGLAGLLLESGANPAAETRIGRHTPIHLPARAGSPRVVRMLADAGADVSAATTTGAAPL